MGTYHPRADQWRFSSDFRRSEFGEESREVTRAETCQAMADSLVSSHRKGSTAPALLQEVRGVGKPVCALPSLGILMAESGTYVGVGGGPSLSPLSEVVSYEGRSIVVAAVVDDLTGSSLTRYLLPKLVSGDSLGPGDTDERFRRLLSSATLNLSGLYVNTAISEAAALAVLHLWGVNRVWATSTNGCLADFLETRTPGGMLSSLSANVDCLTGMDGICFRLESWNGEGEYRDLQPRKFLSGKGGYAHLEKKLGNCQPLPGWEHVGVNGHVDFGRHMHPIEDS